MKFEKSNNFGEIVGFISELRPENIIMEPVERIPVDSEIIILVLALAISKLVDWVKFGVKKVDQKNVVGPGSNLEDDREQLEVAFLLNQTTETVKHMRASIEREQRVGKFYR
jgi:hypothetical protein